MMKAERTVDCFSFQTRKKETRTFAVWLADNPYDVNEGIWNFSSSTFLDAQFDDDGNQLTYLVVYHQLNWFKIVDFDNKLMIDFLALFLKIFTK